MKNPYSLPVLFLLWGFVLVLVAPASAVSGQQTGTIRGTVESSVTNEPLQGVRVSLEEGTLEARTGEDGQFILRDVPAGVTRIKLELPPDFVTSTEQVTVRPGVAVRALFLLVPLVVVMDELQVRGRPAPSDAVVRVYGEGEATRIAGGGTAVDLLVASFAGVQVIRGSGQVGTRSRLLIRGINSISLPGDPLVYLDGIRVSDTPGGELSRGIEPPGILDMIPADLVVRIEILKGPSATRFGVGSSNGVILVFTRRDVRPGERASPDLSPTVSGTPLARTRG